ncbi:MAG: rhamnose/proton symporter RhaT [Kiritimatiellaceae bacterium]|nr:rhamnose/proton symporter RhaT [Kiritimatiellaceae bacterium]RZO88070.1 MAG: rhamnose/proton symporter RhaT [Kiritimatiellaceae bacterium]|tara:strand:+ start:188 stop:1222 length:1035 start_codon:yes stop_codon:yes gene_type:complete
MNELLLPIMIVILASVFQGTFGLGMKYVKPMAWEAWWLVHATVAMVIFPLIWAVWVVPDLGGVLAQAPMNEVVGGAVMGFVWGIGGIMFGVSVGYIGMSLTYGIVMGLCSIAGALIPFFLRFDSIHEASIPFIIIGLVSLAVAVFIVTVAGLKRDKLLAERGEEIQGIQKGAAFKKGLLIAAVCGILSAFLAVGFDNTLEIGKLAQEAGALARNTALARWVVVLAGAYLMNAGYALILLCKNKTFGSFKTPGMLAALKWSIIAGILWFAALGTYGQGVALMGEMGTMICWPTMLGLSLIVSNIAGVITGEWKGVAGPFKIMLAGVGVIILATVVMAYASTLKGL